MIWRKSLSILFFLSGISPSQHQVIFNDLEWQNLDVFEINQTEPHTPLVPFVDESKALAKNKSACPFYLTLDGTWKFKLYERVQDVPTVFFKTDYNVNKWDDITVPSNWQMEGFGHAKFRNIALTFISNPPLIPEDYNPTGCYVRTFNVPNNWVGREIFLHFEGVKSAAYIWVNGQAVGYNQGGFEPAEFNVTPFVKKGRNKIAVKVLSYCDGSYLENQDMWRLSGIFRSVYLFATPKVHMRDYYVVTDLDDQYENADLQLEVDLKNHSKQVLENFSIEMDLLRDGKEIFPTVTKGVSVLQPNENLRIGLQSPVENPLKWSAEKPNLYHLVIRLKDKSGILMEVYAKKIGFRKVEIKKGQICVNGVPVKLNGVNTHMHHPDHGQAVPVETMKRDLILMKQFNINAVRTSHYPPSLEYFDLADELGMYIIDEVGDECHGNEHLSELPEWRSQFIDRSKKMVLRDRNHTSIIFWSAGNECGKGENIKAVIEEGKKYDHSRPGWMYGGNDEDIPFEDIVGPRYWTPLDVKRLAEGEFFGENDTRPSFMDEYLAVTGNSLGGLDEYWELIWKYPRLAGGAIWDWMSPGINAPIKMAKDKSPSQNHGAIMGNAKVIEGKSGKGIYLSGHDDWVEFYRGESLDIDKPPLMIEFWVKPEKIDNRINHFLTKGSHQYGVIMNDKDSLEFYVFGHWRVSAKAKVGDDWYGNWHHVAGIYDGENVELYVDYELKARISYQGGIRNIPYQLCLGRNAEIHDQGEFSGRLSGGTIDEVRIYNKLFSIQTLKNQSNADAQKEALLFLDFENIVNEGKFVSLGLGGRAYGMVWPDRNIQPELWQVKKSAQPVKVEPVDLRAGKVRIINRFNFTNLKEVNGIWKVISNNNILKHGKLILDIQPGKDSLIVLPYGEIVPEENAQYLLELNFSLPEPTLWAEAGHEVAWEQFKLPFFLPMRNEILDNNEVEFDEGEKVIAITGKTFRYEIDKNSGIFSSMNFNGKSVVLNGPEFNVWRAPISNDNDPWGNWKIVSRHRTTGYGSGLHNEWLTIGIDRLAHNAVNFEISKNSKGEGW